MNKLTKRQRVLRQRKTVRLVAKEKRATAFAAANEFAKANPAEKLSSTQSIRARNMRQIVAGKFPAADADFRASIKQLLEVQQLRNVAATDAWKAYVEEYWDLLDREKHALGLELKVV